MSIATSSRERRPDRRRHQVATGATARSYGARWTPEADHELAHGPGTLAERAARLGRTYYAAQYRLTQLRAAGERGQL